MFTDKTNELQSSCPAVLRILEVTSSEVVHILWAVLCVFFVFFDSFSFILLYCYITTLCSQDSQVGIDVPALPDEAVQIFIADMLQVKCYTFGSMCMLIRCIHPSLF